MVAMRGRAWRGIREIGAIALDAYWRLNARGWLGDLQPYRAGDLDLAVSVPDFPHRACRFLGSQDLSDEAAKLIFDAWPPTSQSDRREMHNVLPRRAAAADHRRDSRALLSSGRSRLCASASTAPSEMTETRPWWLLRLESIAYVLIGAVALLALAFLVVLGPLIWAGALRLKRRVLRRSQGT